MCFSFTHCQGLTLFKLEETFTLTTKCDMFSWFVVPIHLLFDNYILMRQNINKPTSTIAQW